jgi:transglutaminase-like putative cysteine protease
MCGMKTIATLAACTLAFAAEGANVTRMDYPDADMVFLDDVTRIEYAPDGSYTSESDERILALTDKGRRALRSATLYVSRRYGDAEFVKVEIIGTNGVARAVDFRKTLKEATDNSSTSANIYDPLDRKITCAVPGIEVGEVRRVVTREKVLKSRMRDAFATGTLFESTHPIVHAAFEVIAPPGRPIANIKLRHPLEGTVKRLPDETLPDGRVRMRWEARNVPQAFAEPDMPAFSSVAQKLLVSTVKSWEDVSRWYWKLCLPRIEATNEAMTNKVAELTKGCATEQEKIRALFKFVSQEVRYMGLMLEEESPGYAPHDVYITFDNRYGVCRDKAALLVAMFRMAGIDAYPVLIYVGPKQDEDVPLPYFNHAVVAVKTGGTKASSGKGGDFVLMDPTNENTKDLLPAYLMDCSYLVAHPDGVPLAVVPVKPPERNAFRAETCGTLEPDGSALVRTSATFGGVNDLFRGGFLKKTPKERRRAFESVLRMSYPGAELLSFELTPADLRNTDEPLAVSLTARLPDLVVRGKTRDELTPPFVFSGFSVVDRLLASGTELEKRRYPLKFFSTALAEERLTLKLGDSVGKPIKMPPKVAEGKDGIRYERQFAVKDGTMTAVRRRIVGTTELSPEGYLRLKDDLKAIELGVRGKPQFAAKGAEQDANVRMAFSRSEVRLATPFAWTTTNVWEKEVLTYAGKKSSAELSYGYNPCVGFVELVSATVSNRNGRVYPVTPKEINLLDAGWVASAPRYPASKRMVVNLPAVEIGSVIRVTVATTITNSPVAYCNLFTLDSTEPQEVREIVVDGVPMKVAFGGDLERVVETNRIELAVTNPAALPREGSQPPALLWRNSALVSAADFEETGTAMSAAMEKARAKGSRNAAAIARQLVEGKDKPEDRIKAVRDWLWKNVRLAGPGMYTLPFDRAFFPPDRSIADSYASAADWMNAYYAMLEAIGCDVEFVLSAGDAATYPEIARVRRAVPQPDDFDDLLIRAKVRDGGWMFGMLGGEEREFILDYENDCTPLGVRDVEGRNGRTENWMSFDVNESGAARITVSNSTWGVAVASLRKRYIEMLPEMRARHHTELIGNIAESAEAISGLETDVDGYPFTITYSAYAPNYAAKSGDALTLVVPGLGGTFMPNSEAGRKSPFGIGGRLKPMVTVREVTFPEGYTKVEHLPEPWKIVLPGDSGARYIGSVTSRVEDGRLHVSFREELLPGNARMLTRDWEGFFRDWNRRTGSRLIRTIIVRK